MRLLKRRWFVRSLIVGCAAAAAVLYRVPQRLRRSVAQFQDSTVAPCFPELFKASDVERIGSAYLAAFPNERTREVLTGLVFPNQRAESLSSRSVQACELLRAAIREGIQRDLAAAELVLVADWRITRTEARLCALASLASA